MPDLLRTLLASYATSQDDGSFLLNGPQVSDLVEAVFQRKGLQAPAQACKASRSVMMLHSSSGRAGRRTWGWLQPSFIVAENAASKIRVFCGRESAAMVEHHEPSRPDLSRHTLGMQKLWQEGDFQIRPA